MAARRPRGSGQLLVRYGNYYGKWATGEQRVQRKLGPVRSTGTREGLTRSQAERELRRQMEREQALAPVRERMTVDRAAERLIDHLEALGRKETTMTVYRSLYRTHLVPHLGTLDLERVKPEDVERMVGRMRRSGTGPKTTVNALALLHQVFDHGRRRGWCNSNPCALVDRPRVEQSADIHYLELPEIEAVLRAVRADEPLGSTDRTLYLTAAMTGLRQGELLALRWRDIDWTAGRVRVRRNYVRGHLGTPKSRRSSRAVPLSDRVAGELERHFQRSHYQDDDDLVFGHPEKGTVLDHSYLVRRFKKALEAAGVRKVRFHDLRHTFGTRMAATGVPMRTLQEWLGHRDLKTTMIYADYAPSAHEAEWVEAAFGGEKVPTRVPN